MSRVFISFVHEDRVIAEAIQRLVAKELKLQNEVFLSADESQVLAGDIWLDKIRLALERCEVLLLVLSARSLRRAWVNFEAGAVWLSKRPVIPICIGRVTKHRLPQPYAGMQAIDLDKDAYYLVKSIHEHLKIGELKPPSPVMRKVIRHILPSPEKPGILEALDQLFDPYDDVQSALSKWQDELPRRSLSSTEGT